MSEPRILVIDIERQSALVDGVWDAKSKRYIHPNQIIEPARTICFAYHWIGEDEISFLAEWHFKGLQDNTKLAPGGGHKKMIQEAHKLLDEADYVVGWNSKAFDVKHLKAAFWAYNMTPPSPHVDLDLMVQTVNNFELMSARLDYVAKQSELEAKLEVDHRLWRKLRFSKGDELAEARERMCDYNVHDVQITAELYYKCLPWLKGMNVALFAETDDVTPMCVNCGSADLESRGWAPARTYRYRRYRCRECGKWNRGRKSFHRTELVGL
ncbi:DNA polymerase exonuclease subunit [Mycobacterium phage Kumao]|uniref:DnaQ-like DNA polymerase III subunit n=1 Tax=Mycobacterium phage Kumao TaxID=2041344 RepID=A0A2D1GQ02_9CAUD|nr:DNA polymerase exonuclease subunit [Mycobacterium phage Kumao]ATN94038.1 DnaQ-like DNA polymerase III subunit [Mycobacterium phage Kumao]